MKKFMNAVKAVAAISVAIYVGDLIVARIRGDATFSTLKVNVLYETPLKGSKIGFSPGGVQDVECVNALFPHFGDAPCWYASKQKTKRVDL
jgi:hypothetical protein